MKTKTTPASKNGSATKATPQSKSSGTSSVSKSSKGTAASSDAASGLRELFEDMLKDIYWAEKALMKAIPKMVKNATSEELIGALQEHLAVTEEQVRRLEQVFESVGKPARAKKCEAMDGLLKEAEEIMKATESGVVRDAGIIAAAQKVEHYEIATYGTLASFARTLGETESADLLDETLNEEKEADQTLTQVAETAVNIGAAEEDEDEEEFEDEEDFEDEEEEEEEEEEEPQQAQAKGGRGKAAAPTARKK